MCCSCLSYPLSLSAAEQSFAISPACAPDTEQWYIELAYHYANPAIAVRSIQLSLGSAAETQTETGAQTEAGLMLEAQTEAIAEARAGAETEARTEAQTQSQPQFQPRPRRFEATVRAGERVLPFYSDYFTIAPTHIVIHDADDWFAVIDARCRPYIPFPSADNAKIPPIDTATLIARNDFADGSSGSARDTARDTAANRASDFALYRWSYFPDILVMDTANYAVLGKLFNRLAFFVEKEGYAGTVRTDAELNGAFAWNGHNYNAQDLANFFSAAERRQVPLNDYERRLRVILLDHGVLHASSTGLYSAGRGGLLAISQQSGTYARRLILRHELLHGTFYSSAEYRGAVWSVWSSLSDEERAGWRALLSHLTYDATNEYVMANEFQAYLLAKPVADSVSQLTAIARTVAARRPDTARPMEALTATQARSLRDAHARLTQFLSAYTGLQPGALAETAY